MAEKLADRTGTYTPDLEDRRRIAVSEVILSAEIQGGAVMPNNLVAAVLDNITGPEEMQIMTSLVTKRLLRIAQGGGY